MKTMHEYTNGSQRIILLFNPLGDEPECAVQHVEYDQGETFLLSEVWFDNIFEAVEYYYELCEEIDWEADRD